MADLSIQMLIVGVAMAVAGCDRNIDRLPEYELSGQVMGTTYSVKVVAPSADTDLEQLGVAIDERLRAIDGRMSTYKTDSEVTRINMNRSTDWLPVSAELCEVLDRSIAISKQTDGAFDITVGPLVDLWGFGTAGDNILVPQDEKIEAAHASVGYQRLHVDCSKLAIRKEIESLSVDLSAFAKGYAVDQAAEILITAGQKNFLMEIGGELRMRGLNAVGEPWAIAIERPDSAGRSVDSVIRVTDAAMATSGDYRNFFEMDGIRYSHTLDPKTGWPVTHDGASVTVVTDTAARADALATALLVMGPTTGLEFAVTEDIAAYFLVRTDRGYEQHATGAFARLVKK